MLKPDAPIMPKRLAGKVFEKLIRPGRFPPVEKRETPENRILLQLAAEPQGPQNLAFKGITAAFFELATHLTWTLSKSGPFASRNFENSHGHAVLVGPGGIEERNDVRIGVTILAPYTRFPDHTLYQPRAFLALSQLEFCTESDSWKRLQAGEIAYSGAGEVVAMRCTTKPLLMLWCNAERR
ncbi:dimethylsulfonioproprionate lyase family protein [Rhizobium leguminosarum]|uniref:dimethylsulfonioproprionate lyase family protein n=1 Tax=Rhizobium leguminosarum TaxID=384 RepID=UPI003F98C2BC